MMKWFVYVIWARNEDGEEVRYYGHTYDMKEREKEHRKSYNAWVRAGRPDKISQTYACSSVFVLDMEEWSMDVLHELECDEEEASRVEGNYIRNNKCVNRLVAGRTRQQYHQDNKERLNAKSRQYHQDNCDRLNERNREYNRTYRQANKEKRTEKVPCECGLMIKRGNMWQHLKSQKHAKRMQQSTS